MEQLQINIGQRLLCVADFIQKDAVLCDVGTDHAKLPIYLAQTKRIKKAFATDINQGPINSAKNNISKLGLSQVIECIKTDGLKNTDGLMISDVCICGMGGELIARILSECDYIKDPSVNLVLQPMSHAEDLRRYLYENGFCVVEEKLVRESDKLYVVINAHFCGERYDYEPFELYLGNKLSAAVDGELYRDMCSRVLYHLENRQKSNDPAEAKEAKELYDEIKLKI